MKIGSVLGHYHVVRTLGRGGMGAVYEANDTRLNRQVALKVLPAKMASNPEWYKRFEREAQAVAALDHPNIVTIHAIEEADDLHFIVLELVGGKPLDALIPADGLPVDQFFDIAIPLADAIAAAHKRGIAHRDLKPGNVMVDDAGRVKVLDFGIAKMLENIPEDEAATQIGSEALTEEGKIVGTVAYMSPEQAEGKHADHRSDIFSLGIMLYEMATGDRPFVGDTKLSILASIVKDAPTPIVERNLEMPRHLARIVKKALEKDTRRRYQSMVELRNDLLELKEEIDAGELLTTGGMLTDAEGIAAYRDPTNVGFRKERWLGIAGIVVAIAALSWAFWGRTSDPSVGAAPQTTLTQLTTTSGEDFGGTISPDGVWFAFTRLAESGYEIHLQSLASRRSIRIAESGVSPAFSRNGERIAFSGPPTSNADFSIGGGIFVMGVTGDDMRQLTDTGFNPSWSPDGAEIVYSNEFVWSEPYSRSAGLSPLRVVNVNTAEPRVLDMEDGAQPSWSPDGGRIAYWAIEGGQRDIWTISAAGSDIVRVTEDLAVDFSPVWSPDGEWLYFASTRGGSMAIWRVAIDQASGQTSGSPQQITSGGLSEPGMLSLSADGTKLLYTETMTSGRIVTGDFDAASLTISGDLTPVVEGSRRLAQPDVSPDGTRIVYRTGGARQDLFVARTDQPTELQITDNVAKDWAPRWSPDGTRIVYYADPTGDYDVWTIDPDGTRPARLTDLPGNLAPLRPIWSPDGSQIVYSVRDEDTFTIDASADPAQQVPAKLPKITDPPGIFLASDWHPDGRRIVGESLGIWLYDVETTQFERLAPEGSVEPAWMADGRRVVYRVVDPPGFLVVDTVTGELRPVQGPQADAMVLSPDNTRAYFVHTERQSDIWLIDLH